MADEVQIDSLSVAIEQSANDSSDSLARLAKNLGELKSAVSGLRLTSTVNGLRGIADATSKLDRDKVAALGELGGALAKISGAGKISSSFAKQIAGIGAAIDGLGDIDAAKLTGLADALSPLASLDRAKLTSYINQLKQLPEVADALDGMDMDRFAASIRRAADAMKPLADEMEKVSNGFSALPTKIQRIIRENERMTASTKRGATGWKALRSAVRDSLFGHSVVRELLGITSATTVFFKVANKAIYALKSATDYTENLNLFSVAMGEYAEEAYDYAKEVESVLGIDDKEWIRHQGTLMDMARGYGVASDAAYTMSKALTQLTYDFMSFYNIESFSESANKMRSALAGEIEPIRALGKDLSVASLQLMATKLGIDENVDAMTQAEKAVLRTIVLLDRSGTAAGDLARTLDDPANQFRILNAQMTLFARSVGDLMLPLVKEALPYLTATFRVMRMITKEFARLAGIELPDINTEVSTEQTESLGEALGEAADEAKRLFQLSFDELNILGSQAGTGSNDSMDKLVEEMERLAAIQDAAFMKDVEDSVAGITDELVDWLTKGEGIEKWVGNIYEKFTNVKETVDIIGQKLGWWDGDLETTGEVLDTVVNGFERILKAAIKIKGLQILNNLSKALTGDNLLASALKKIFGNTEEVAGAFEKKNEKLKQQTKDTAADTVAVEALSAGLVKANNNVLTTALSLGVMGAAAAALSKLLSENPLTPVVDTTAVSDSYAEILEKTAEFGTEFTTSLSDTTAKAGETVAMGAAQNYATLLTWLANTEVSSAGSAARVEFQWNKAWEGINEDAVNYSTSILSTVDSLGNSLYDGMTSPIIRAADVFAGTLEDMWDDYAAFNAAIGNPVGGSFRAKGASGAGSYTSTAGSSFAGTIYGNSWKDSQQKDQQMQAAVDAAVKAAADAAAAGFFETNRNNAVAGGIADAITGVIDKTLGILGKVLGFGSMSFGVPAFAGGGIVEDGLFMANSTELIGRFANGRTAVANNEQITAGIANGVREANHELISVIYAAAQQIVQAVNEGSVIYLDTDRVTKKVTDSQNRSNRMHGV